MGSRAYGSEEFERRYRDLEALKLSPPDIRRALVKDFGDSSTPPLRTIRSWVTQDRKLDKNDPWRLWMSEPEDVPAVLESLAAAITVSDGATRWLSAKEAEWIARIVRMGTTAGGKPLDPFGRFLGARLLARSEARDPKDVLGDLIFILTTDHMAGPARDLMTSVPLSEWMSGGALPPRTPTSTPKPTDRGGTQRTRVDSGRARKSPSERGK
jgi:hypothetical protein